MYLFTFHMFLVHLRGHKAETHGWLSLAGLTHSILLDIRYHISYL